MTDFAKTIQLSNEISQQLFLCASKESIEDVFKKFDVSHAPDKIGLLRFCMGIKNISFSPLENLSSEQLYEDTLLIFLDGSWRFLI